MNYDTWKAHDIRDEADDREPEPTPLQSCVRCGRDARVSRGGLGWLCDMCQRRVRPVRGGYAVVCHAHQWCSVVASDPVDVRDFHCPVCDVIPVNGHDRYLMHVVPPLTPDPDWICPDCGAEIPEGDGRCGTCRWNEDAGRVEP